MNKYIILAIIVVGIIFVGFFATISKAKEEFIVLCKLSKESIRIDYWDSTHGIYDVKKNINADTLELKVLVRFLKKSNLVVIHFNESVKFIRIDNKVFEIEKLGKCYQIEPSTSHNF